MPNYWVVSSNVTNVPAQENHCVEVIRKTHCVFMGYPCDQSYGITFCTDVQIGDIILIARRESFRRKLTAIGRVETDAETDPLPEVIDLDYGAYRKPIPFIQLEIDPDIYGMNFGSSRVLVELGETDQDPLFKVDKVAKTVAHPFHCFDRTVNTIDNAGRESMSEVVQYILLPVIEHIKELVQMFISICKVKTHPITHKLTRHRYRWHGPPPTRWQTL